MGSLLAYMLQEGEINLPMRSTTNLIDFAGREIFIGDQVAALYRADRAMELKMGMVIGATNERVRVSLLPVTVNDVSLKHPKDIVVIVKYQQGEEGCRED